MKNRLNHRRETLSLLSAQFDSQQPMTRYPIPHLTLFLLFFISLPGMGQEPKPVTVGIFTDCQYCNCEPGTERYYRLSTTKLDSCIKEFNTLNLDGVFHLGDMIDHGYESYDSILPRFRQFRAPLHLVLGNHDYMIKKQYKPGLPGHIGMKEDHYRVDLGQWTFLVLNGDDLSYVAPQTRVQKEERNEQVSILYSNLGVNGMIWNGGIGIEQMKWLDAQLTDAGKENRKVIVVCHFPLFSRSDHNLFNRDELFAMIARYPCVKAYFCGHYHSGSYTRKEGIHIVNFKGMVNTGVNAFAVVTLTADSILIRGYGRETSRRLGVR
ncbi:MAG: metallophosphoesterase [Bacteroidetes bacterium]|nr:metallophosphoesterase [Bacteroidota bacterium]